MWTTGACVRVSLCIEHSNLQVDLQMCAFLSWWFLSLSSPQLKRCASSVLVPILLSLFALSGPSFTFSHRHLAEVSFRHFQSLILTDTLSCTANVHLLNVVAFRVRCRFISIPVAMMMMIVLILLRFVLIRCGATFSTGLFCNRRAVR